MNTPTTKNITKLGLHSTFEFVNVALSISCNGCNFQKKVTGIHKFYTDKI